MVRIPHPPPFLANLAALLPDESTYVRTNLTVLLPDVRMYVRTYGRTYGRTIIGGASRKLRTSTTVVPELGIPLYVELDQF